VFHPAVSKDFVGGRVLIVQIGGEKWGVDAECEQRARDSEGVVEVLGEVGSV